MINLSRISSVELRKLAKKAISLANEQEQSNPSYKIALEAGIVDISYINNTNKTIASYTGEVEITMENGSKWKAIGHKPEGNSFIENEGFIEFIPL